MTLTELCQELKNWFVIDQYFGEFEISDGELSLSSLKENQYFRIVGSVFNDGVHQKGHAGLTDEIFSGSVWAMAVPPTVIDLLGRINSWEAKYGEAIASPYTSESFGGYSYSKSSGSRANGNVGNIDYKSVFGDELNRWRKV